MSGEKERGAGGSDLGAALEKVQAFMKPRAWPERPALGESDELDKAVEAFLAPVPEAPPRQDLSIGMGNAKDYAEGAPVVASSPRSTVTRVEIAPTDPLIAPTDVLKELPAGNPEATTDEVETSAFQRARTARPRAANAPVAALPLERPSAQAPSSDDWPAGVPVRGWRRPILAFAAGSLLAALVAWAALFGPQRVETPRTPAVAITPSAAPQAAEVSPEPGESAVLSPSAQMASSPPVAERSVQPGSRRPLQSAQRPRSTVPLLSPLRTPTAAPRPSPTSTIDKPIYD